MTPSSTHLPSTQLRNAARLHIRVKVKVRPRQEFVVGGWHPGERGLAGKFGSFLVGVYQEDRLRYCGKVGTGYTDRERDRVGALLAALAVDESPFNPPPAGVQRCWSLIPTVTPGTSTRRPAGAPPAPSRPWAAGPCSSTCRNDIGLAPKAHSRRCRGAGSVRAHHAVVPSHLAPGPARIAPALPGADTLTRLASTRSWRRFGVDVSGPGWVRLADRLADPAGVDAWLAAELAGTARGHRDLAGSLVAYRLAGSLAELAVVPLLHERRAFVLSPEGLWLSFAGARIEAVGLPTPTVAVLAADPDAGRPGTMVADGTDALHDVVAGGLAATFAGVAVAVRARAPFGLAGIWGTLTDHLADVALRWSRHTGGDPDRAWSVANAVIDALARRPEPRLRARPRRHDVTCAAGSGAFVTRGTCCLIYKAHEPAPGEPDRTRDQIMAAACTSCPLRPFEDRQARLVRLLTDQADDL